MAKKNDVDDDGVGTTAPMDVTIAADNNPVTALVEGDEGNHMWL